jgi:hypothetical protein
MTSGPGSSGSRTGGGPGGYLSGSGSGGGSWGSLGVLISLSRCVVAVIIPILATAMVVLGVSRRMSTGWGSVRGRGSLKPGSERSRHAAHRYYEAQQCLRFFVRKLNGVNLS